MPPITVRALCSSTVGTIERDHDQRQLAVFGEELALDDVVRLQGGDHRVEGGALLGQLVGHHGGRVARRIGLGARRQHGDEAADAVGQLQLDDGVLQRLHAFAGEQGLAGDGDEDVELARRKAPVDLLVLPEFRRIGAEELRQAVVDAQVRHAPDGQSGEQQDQERREARRLQRHETEFVEAERKKKRAARRVPGGHVRFHPLDAGPIPDPDTIPPGSVARPSPRAPYPLRGRTQKRGPRIT